MGDINEAIVNIKQINTMQLLIVGTMILLFVIAVVVLAYLIVQFSKIIKSSTQSSVTALTPPERPDVLSDYTQIQDEVYLPLETSFCGAVTQSNR